MDDLRKRKVRKMIKKPFYQVIFSRFFMTMSVLLIQLLLLMILFLWVQHHTTQFFVLYLLIGFITLLWVMNSKNSPMYKMTWAIIVAFLPVMGSLMYLITHGTFANILPQIQLRNAEKETVAYSVTMPAVDEKIKKNETRDFVKLSTYLEMMGYPTFTNTEIKYYSLGDYVFDDLIEALENAKEFIFLEFFIISQGEFWDSILEVLKKKADEGVEVRVLYDGLGSGLNLPFRYDVKLNEMGIRTKVFSRLRPFFSSAYNNRDHRKILVIDGEIAFSGGFNLADEYLNLVERFGHWKDQGFRLRGDAVRSYTMLFLQMWNATEPAPHEYAKYLDTITEYKGMTEDGSPIYASKIDVGKDKDGWDHGYVIPYGDGPYRPANVAENVYIDVISSALDYVYIMTPYFVPDNEMIHALKHASRSGVDVRIILPGIPDKKVANLVAKSYYQELVSAGIKVYEYEPGFVHTKMMVSDHRMAVMGTINLDYRSLDLHYECASVVFHDSVVLEAEADFEETLKYCRRITDEMLAKQNPVYVTALKVLRLLGPLM